MKQLSHMVDLYLLESTADLEQYLKQTYNVVDVLQSCFQACDENTWYPLTTGIMLGYLERLRESLRLLRLKYYFNSNEYLTIDRCESGFPYNLMFADFRLDGKKSGSDLNENALRKRALDDILRSGYVCPQLLHDVTYARYARECNSKKILLPFTFGGLGRYATTHNNRSAYVCHWGTYDLVGNVPCVYAMLFECSTEPGGEMDEDSLTTLVNVLEAESAFMPYLGDMARAIDDAVENIHPKYVRRTILGPVYTRGWVSEHNPLANILESTGTADDVIVALTTESVLSIAEYTVGNNGHKIGTTRVCQQFKDDGVDTLSYLRRATNVSYRLLVPHHVLQQVDARDYPDYQLQSIDQTGGAV